MACDGTRRLTGAIHLATMFGMPNTTSSDERTEFEDQLAANAEQMLAQMTIAYEDSLLFVARFRARSRQAGVGEVTIAGKYVRFAPVDLPDSRVVRLQRVYPKSIVKAPVSTILVPRPQTAVVGGKPLAGVALLEWARTVIDTVIDPRSDS